MSDQEIRDKRSWSRKKNYIAKSLRDQGDHKGVFALKIHDPRKGEYKRIKKVRLDTMDEETEY